MSRLGYGTCTDIASVVINEKAEVSNATLRQKIRTRLASGSPFPVDGKVFAGKGTGKLCTICEMPISQGDIEHEVVGQLWSGRTEIAIRSGGKSRKRWHDPLSSRFSTPSKLRPLFTLSERTATASIHLRRSTPSALAAQRTERERCCSAGRRALTP